MNSNKKNIQLRDLKAYIFDLGGVLLNIDFQKSEVAFRELLSDEQLGKLKQQTKNGGIFNDLETGHFSPSEFREAFRQITGSRLNDKEIDFACNQLIRDYPPERIRLLEQLTREKPCYLLSNTNKIHADYYSEKLEKEFGYKNLDELLEKAFYSFNMNCRKPDLKIFKIMLEEINLQAEELLFFDDSEENIKAAQSLGMNAIKVDEQFTINHFFADSGLFTGNK